VSIAGMHIDRASAVPIHLQIIAHLRNCILQGILPAGTQFSRFAGDPTCSDLTGLGCMRKLGMLPHSVCVVR
jgi:hypothetical protein